jgi:hypothetical protein
VCLRLLLQVHDTQVRHLQRDSTPRLVHGLAPGVTQRAHTEEQHSPQSLSTPHSLAACKHDGRRQQAVWCVHAQDADRYAHAIDRQLCFASRAPHLCVQ